MLGSVDLRGLFDRTVVQPEHNVPVIIEFGAGHRDGLVGVVGEDGQGASRIKCQASNSRRVDVVLVEYAVYRGADTSPDVVRRLFLRATVSSRCRHRWMRDGE